VTWHVVVAETHQRSLLRCHFLLRTNLDWCASICNMCPKACHSGGCVVACLFDTRILTNITYATVSIKNGRRKCETSVRDQGTLPSVALDPSGSVMEQTQRGDCYFATHSSI
jgi:hypothetical protein